MELKAWEVEMDSEEAKILLICEYRLVMAPDIRLIFVKKNISS